MSRVVVLDFETYPYNGKSLVMEIGCVEIIDGQIGDSFQTMVRPVDKVNDFVLNLTGISQAVLDSAPLFTSVVDKFQHFVKNSIIIAHNAPLDRMSYESLCEFYQIQPIVNDWIDSQDLLKILAPTNHSLQLQVLLEKYQIPSKASHRAYDDALGLAKLMLIFKASYVLELTKYEVGLLKKSANDSIVKLIRFLLRFFVVKAPSTANKILTDPIGDLDVTRDLKLSPILCHLNSSSEDFFCHLKNTAENTIIVTDSNVDTTIDYIDDYCNYIYPVKISRFYLFLINYSSSNVELVEILGIINWLRQTNTFHVKELNENLQVRINQIYSESFESHPIEKVYFLTYLIDRGIRSSNVIQCHYSTMALIIEHRFEFIRLFNVAFHNFSYIQSLLHSNNVDHFSLKSLKPLKSVLLSFSALINYYSLTDECDLKFVQDVARIRHFIDLINQEKQPLFNQLDSLINVLSVNIYKNKRQVLVNHNVRETLEWQDLSGHIKLITHYFDEILRILDRIGFYISHEYSDWIGDLTIQFKYKKQLLTDCFLKRSQYVQYIESSVKHSPSTCSLSSSRGYQHEFYKSIYEHAQSLVIHQVLSSQFSLAFIDRLLGVSFAKHVDYSVYLAPQIKFISYSNSQLKTLIESSLTEGNVCLVFQNQYRLRFWRKCLYALIRKQKNSSNITLSLVTLKYIHQVKTSSFNTIIFPEFQIPNALQPIHQLRLQSFDGQEIEYNDQILAEHVYNHLSQLIYFKDANVIFNVEQMDTTLTKLNKS